MPQITLQAPAGMAARIVLYDPLTEDVFPQDDYSTLRSARKALDELNRDRNVFRDAHYRMYDQDGNLIAPRL